MVDHKSFSKELLAWYSVHRRDLPWRKNGSAYQVWLSEIILQQTRIAQGLPYYRRFIAAYPTVHHLAKATTQDVLLLWEGLGYYTRARNLHKCAQHVVNELGGVFPKSYHALKKLPGIGPYTAAAIASIVWGEAVAAVDGNVYRVLARVFGIEDDVGLPTTQRKVRVLSQSLMDYQMAGDYNQALMEFGALHCTPKKPMCSTCIFQDVCVANRLGKQAQLPVKKCRVKIKHRYFHYIVVACEGKVYLNKRKEKDIWKGLYDFYLVEREKVYGFEDLKDGLLAKMKRSGALVRRFDEVYKHQLTHQRIYVTFFYVEVAKGFLKEIEAVGLVSFSREQIKKIPKPVIITKFIEKNDLHKR